MDLRKIVAFGGYPSAGALDAVFELAGGRKVLYDHTASPGFEGEELDAEVTHLSFYPWPPPDLRELALAQDVIFVAGGNTANLLAVWRTHGFDRILGEAWEAGVVLSGWSAGMICWFEAGVTDSFGPELAGLRDGLGLLPGSACPHYDGEERRRPVYERLVHDEGFPPGLALDDAAGAHYAGTELQSVWSATDVAAGYLVGPAGEQRLDVARLS